MKLSLFLTCLHIMYSSSVPSYKTPTWVNLHQISRTDLHPEGNENGHDVFIARGYHENSWIPGKMLGRNSDIVWLPYYGEKKSQTIQVLYYPPGTAKWVNPSVYGNVDAIDGGWEPSFSLYICRAWVKDNLLTGKYSKSTLTCYVPYFGEHKLKRNVELLVHNKDLLTTSTTLVPMQVKVELTIEELVKKYFELHSKRIQPDMDATRDSVIETKPIKEVFNNTKKEFDNSNLLEILLQEKHVFRTVNSTSREIKLHSTTHMCQWIAIIIVNCLLSKLFVSNIGYI